MAISVKEQYPCSCTKDQDTIVDATRTFLVTGLTATTAVGKWVEAMAASGIPAYGDALPGNPNIICKTVECSIAPNGPDTNFMATVTAKYTTLGLEDGNYIFRCTSSLNEEVTNSDANGNLVTLSYTYPDPYPQNPSLQGVTVTQTPEMSVQLPQIVLTATGIDAVSKPVAVVADWVGYVNSDSWQGFPPGCWLCTAVPFEPLDLDASPPRYKFTFEFQLNKKGWTQVVQFRDDNGDIPADLVYGVGRKRIVTQGYKAFGAKFPDA